MRVLWDTNVISYWLGDNPRFRASLQRAVADFGRATFFVSAVTTQELMVWARLKGAPEGTFAFLGEHFTALDFTDACALEGARLAALVGRPRKALAGTRAQHRETVAVWQRDAAIAATAHHHGLDALFTANGKDFEPFVEHVSYKLHVAAP